MTFGNLNAANEPFTSLRRSRASTRADALKVLLRESDAAKATFRATRQEAPSQAGADRGAAIGAALGDQSTAGDRIKARRPERGGQNTAGEPGPRGTGDPAEQRDPADPLKGTFGESAGSRTRPSQAAASPSSCPEGAPEGV
ncbi:hypothetical protein GCM10009754_59180 [Amycolatopsis minnesotensis]|uniref:Uncharacterized protein n=1 Tax=Amycolatopsis minnesotensis TaxID=337894 RepID=A0ABN2RW35_9PSEU